MPPFPLTPIGPKPTRAERKAKKVERTCRHCGRAFVVPAFRIAHGRGRYCSPKCRDSARAVKWPDLPHANACGHNEPDPMCGYCKRKLKTRRPKACAHCGKTFWSYKHNRSSSTKFCCAKCYDAARARRPLFIETTCQHCGGVFRRHRAALTRSKRTFCGRECARAFTRGPNSALYRGDKDTHRGPEWNRIAARIRERDCHRCRWCGKTESDNKQKLSVDHVVPWRAFENKLEANADDNLVSLCRSCHQKKTIGAERRWLRGDVLGLQAYRRNVGINGAPSGGHAPAADRMVKR